MKTKLFFSVAFITISMLLNAKGKPDGYVVTDVDTIACKSLSFGYDGANITLANGEKTLVNKENVKAYSLNGKKFENLPVYVDGKPNGNNSFLELVAERNGLKLFKYSYYDTNGWDATKSVEDMKKVTVLTIFKDNKYYVQVDQKNAKTILPYFNLNEYALE